MIKEKKRSFDMRYKASQRKSLLGREKKWAVYAVVALVILILFGIGFLIYRLSNNQAAETMAPPVGTSESSDTPSTDPASGDPAPEAPESSEAADSSAPADASQAASMPPEGEVPTVPAPAAQTGSYQDWYPDLNIPKVEYTSKEKTAYLTFDDGPSANTDTILDVLKEKGVKATFFVVGSEGPDAMRRMQRIVNEGHTIAIHSYTHDYKKIYASPEAFLEDFEHISTLVESYTGVKPNIFRFPGGTVNSYNKAVYKDITAEMLRRGYTFYDWNVATGDAASGGATKQQCIDNVLNDSINKNRAFILCHDAGDKQTTAEALPAIIDGLIEQGFSLEALDNTVKPVTIPYDK